ncbi:MAG TPA: hypothetical protein DCG28_00870 [Lachnospiraceae bacterium]|nr:hypothetical protein [Lachnospiraceae bacterium]
MKDFFAAIKENRARLTGFYWFAVIFTAIASYGFEMANCSIGLDDELIKVQLDRELIEAGRTGLNFINLFFNTSDYLPFVYLFMCVVFMIGAAYIICTFFNIESKGDFNLTASIIFSAVLISWPDFAYKFEYNVNLFQMGTVIFVSALLVPINYYSLSKKGFIALTLGYLYLVMNYETALLFTSLCYFFGLVLVSKKRVFSDKEIIKRIIFFISPVILALIINFFIQRIAVNGLGLFLSGYVEGFILYGEIPFFVQILDVTIHTIIYGMTDGLKGLLFYAMVICFVVYTLASNKNKWYAKLLLIVGFLLMYSAVFYLLGRFLVGGRVVLYISYFWALCLSSVYLLINEKKKLKYFKPLFGFIMIVFVFNNIISINRAFFHEYLLSERNKDMAYTIYTDLKRMGYNNEKPVIMPGKFEGHDLLYNDTTVSIFAHDYVNEKARRSTQTQRRENYFALLGYNINFADDVTFRNNEYLAEDMPVYPCEGYIKEFDDVVVVKLGNIDPFENITEDRVKTDSNLKEKQEHFQYDKDRFSVDGWGYFEGENQNAVHTYAAFKKGDELFLIKCGSLERKDVVEENKLYSGYRWCGYSLDVPSSLIPKGFKYYKMVYRLESQYYVSK